jgi:RNA-directed DNA polymerase
METLREAYALAKENDGAPGVDGVTFEATETHGVEVFLEQIRGELVGRTYKPLPARRQEIPKDGGKVRVLSIPAIRDRVVQGALKLILEPIFEANFQPGSLGYRPKRTAHEAIDRVAKAILQRKTRIIDLDLKSYFDNVRHDQLLAKVAKRIDDDDVMHLLKIMLKANGRCGVPQGGVVSPLLSNVYLNEVDRMLERAKEVTRNGKYTCIEYARFADDLVILIDAHPRQDWLLSAVRNASGKNWPLYKSRSTKRRVESWTSAAAKASASSALTSVVCAVVAGIGVRATRQSSRSGRLYCGHSRRYSAAINRNQSVS